MYKKTLLASALTLSIATGFAQKNNLVNAHNYLNRKEPDKAKVAIDAAAEHEDTKSSPKMWVLRAETYMALQESKDEKLRALDPEAAVKALTAVINCLKSDKDKEFLERVTPIITPAAYRVFNKSIEFEAAGNYDKAIEVCKQLFEVIPYDKDGSLKRANITNDKVNLRIYQIAMRAKNNAVAKEYIQKLIDIKYKDPMLYYNMAELYKAEGNMDKALSYVDMGRGLFEDDINLIALEINYYIEMKKTDVLLDKVKKACENAPDNELLMYNLGSIYQQTGNYAKAEEAYKKCLEIKPDYADANFNLGAMYSNSGVEFAKQAESVPPKETKKYDELNAKANAEFAKAIPYLEKASESDPKNKQIARALMSMYSKTGQTDKYNKIKEQIQNIK